MLAFNPVTNEASLQKHVYQLEKVLRRPTHYGRARAIARSDHYVFALFFRIPSFIFFFFFYFLCHEICRKVIVSNAFAYGTEIWQVDSLWKYADRMFISHKSAEGFQRGRDAYHTFLAFLACRHGWRCAGRYGLQRIKLTAVHGFGMMR
jgi:hypothetical protein